ncbi:MAG: hypothetical protein M1339_05875 [Bacteroidetes bacterium]|nr:hypothetical protein [Bacteroidota bacterium]
MKYVLLLFSAILVLFLAGSSSAQISNVKVDGSTTSFTMISGDTITWSYNVNPSGASTTVQVWYDVNRNGTIDPATDVLWQLTSSRLRRKQFQGK